LKRSAAAVILILSSLLFADRLSWRKPAPEARNEWRSSSILEPGAEAIDVDLDNYLVFCRSLKEKTATVSEGPHVLNSESNKRRQAGPGHRSRCSMRQRFSAAVFRRLVAASTRSIARLFFAPRYTHYHQPSPP
jgi:hypothetical protein